MKIDKKICEKYIINISSKLFKKKKKRIIELFFFFLWVHYYKINEETALGRVVETVVKESF